MVGVNYHFLFEGIVGNVGGLKFCRWYGFSGRVEWCACFISWCANQCGYIEKGIIPKFAAVGDGVDWFKARGQFRRCMQETRI